MYIISENEIKDNWFTRVDIAVAVVILIIFVSVILGNWRNRGTDWKKEYNNFPMRPLGWLSPKKFLRKIKFKKNRL